MQNSLKYMLFMVWPLLFGIFMIMAGNGLQGTLLGLRANFEGFSAADFGFVMSLYYVGFLLGSWYVPDLVTKVGHIRVFTALASLASTTVLLHSVFVDVISWSLIRVVAGFAYAGMFLVAESWLNGMAPNKLRARIFTSYLFVIHAGMFIGQFMINLAAYEGYTLFILVSVLVSLSMVPIALSTRPAPEIEAPERLSFRELFKLSPFAMSGVFTTGFVGAIVFGLGALYAAKIGMDIVQTSIFMGTYVFGCAFLPLFIGGLSDLFDRRKVLIGIVAAAVVTALLTSSFVGWAVYPFFFLLGGLTLSVHGVATAHMNDRITPGQRVSATGTMILVNGAGSCLGPFVVGSVMDSLGNQIFFYAIVVIYAVLLMIGVGRLLTVKAAKVAKAAHKNFMPLPLRSSYMVAEINEPHKRKKRKD